MNKAFDPPARAELVDSHGRIVGRAVVTGDGTVTVQHTHGPYDAARWRIVDRVGRVLAQSRIHTVIGDSVVIHLNWPGRIRSAS
jgi:hypothetical protein